MPMFARYVSAAIATFMVAIAFAAACGPSAAAQGGLTLSPLLKDITLGPGLLETSTDVSLANNTAEPMQAQLKLVDLKALGIYGGSSLDKAGLPDAYGLANWLSLPAGDTVTIAPGKTTKVKVIITNRTDLTPGGHYGALLVTPVKVGGTSGNVNISQQLVSLIFAKKLGGEQYGLDLKDIILGKITNGFPESVGLGFLGTGNVHVTPRGYVEITDPKGVVVAKAIINPDSSLVLPGASKTLTASFQQVASSAASGRYKVTAYYRNDEQQEFKTQAIYFDKKGRYDSRILMLAGPLLIASITVLAVYLLRKKIRKTQR